MKVQSSMEFMIILVAVSAFAASALGIYSGFFHTQHASFENILSVAGSNKTVNWQLNNVQNAYIEVYAPHIAYLNESSSLQVAVYADNAIIESASMSSPFLRHTPSGYSGIEVDGVSILPFNIMPSTVGEENATVSVGLDYNGSIHYYNKSVQLYSIVQGSSFNASKARSSLLTFSASLYPHSISVLSSISKGASLYKITEWSHCSYTNFFHNELSMQAECGNAKWYFWIFSSRCYYNSGSATRTYCIYENPSGASTYAIAPNTSYSYNVTLDLYNSSSGVYLSSELLSSRHSNPIESINGSQVGNAIVGASIAAYVPSQYYSYYLLNKSGNYTAVNESAYSQYLQAYNNMNYVLSYYNSTGIDSSELSSIQQAISSYNTQSGIFYYSKPAASPCNVIEYSGSYWYSCSALSMEFGNITAFLETLPHLNSSEVFDGSNINVR
ncbi:MAG: hypothetical protein ACP5UC_00620 [Candidatus Micrarchaeia archaeon]